MATYILIRFFFVCLSMAVGFWFGMMHEKNKK
jgi:hypothetical protein